MPVTPLLINNSRLVTYYNARASNWTVDHPCRRVPWLERTLTMGRRFLWIAHHDGVVCATGVGLLARAELAAQMFFAAMDEHVQHHNQSLPNFAPVSLSVDDEVCNVADLAFCTTALRGRDHPHNLSRAILQTTQRRCRERLIPSWITESWAEKGVHDFASDVAPLATIAANATNVSTCGWAGNALSDLPCNSKCGCNAKMMAEKHKPEGCATSVVRCAGKDACALSSPRQRFVATASRLPTIAIHDIGLKVSTGLSLSEQTRRWGCLLDIRGNGFSARVPALLHTNRTLLFVLRHNLYTWLEDPSSPAQLKPWEHYVPVRENLDDLSERLSWTLRNRNGAAAAIAARGLAFARRRLTRDAARRYALRQLLAVVRARAHAPPADPKSAWCRQSLCVTL